MRILSGYSYVYPMYIRNDNKGLNKGGPRFMAFVTSESVIPYQLPTPIAWEELIPVLRKYCLSLTGSMWDAEDLVQSACLQLLRQNDNQAVSVRNPEAYLIRTARNLWLDQLRSSETIRKLQDKLQGMALPLEEGQQLGLEIEHALQCLLRWLSPLQRTVFLLREVWSFRTPETAELLNMTEGAVKAALSRARNALEQHKRSNPYGAEVMGSTQEAMLLKQYLAAFRTGDTRRLVELGLQDGMDPMTVAGQVLEQRAAVRSSIRYARAASVQANKVSGSPRARCAA